ncbi:cytochrome oxidase maturation protein, cbb3-type [Psychromonas ingrahamii 37]|uniref:Cytochrome oxidase maturation protein, cbb3-type n=1 Tax=Psychromonas ingrahamii (strain DSM 17664 / CCUG 51855 / 37) TaxID=357804 RepID=A1STG0_PSYIN|nr:cbb3-type cytochrome oxidase assembly protein CcoS [Psychromonas ingrahamii]ABM02775.1 cytochrome oxidase maturation protein, cbb3-type [Psychromonas ingrahamii 37]
MSIIYILIPIAMIFVTIAIIVFFWAVKSNQYDDLDREGVNILFDEDLPAPPIKEDTESQQKTIKPSDLND